MSLEKYNPLLICNSYSTFTDFFDLSIFNISLAWSKSAVKIQRQSKWLRTILTICLVLFGPHLEYSGAAPTCCWRLLLTMFRQPDVAEDQTQLSSMKELHYSPLINLFSPGYYLEHFYFISQVQDDAVYFELSSFCQ